MGPGMFGPRMGRGSQIGSQMGSQMGRGSQIAPGMSGPRMDLPPAMDPSRAASFARSPSGPAWASGWAPPLKGRSRMEVDSRDLPPQLAASLTARYSERPKKRNWVDRLTKGVLGFEARDIASTKMSLPDPTYSPMARHILQQREQYLGGQEQYRQMPQSRMPVWPPVMEPSPREWEEYQYPMEEEMEEGQEEEERGEGPEGSFGRPSGGRSGGPWRGPKEGPGPGPWGGGAM